MVWNSQLLPLPQLPDLLFPVVLGAAVGGGINLAWQLSNIFDSPNPPKGFWETLERLDFFELALFTAGGATIATLPDILEPATNPNHRALFHSLACGGAVTYGAFGKHTKNLSPDAKHALRVAALSYLSHLLMDSNTPKGLPVVGLPAINI